MNIHILCSNNKNIDNILLPLQTHKNPARIVVRAGFVRARKPATSPHDNFFLLCGLIIALVFLSKHGKKRHEQRFNILPKAILPNGF